MDLLPLLLFSLVATVTPGPNNLMILSAGLNHGVRQALPHYWGICLGFPPMIFALCLGVGAVFGRWPWLYAALQITGGAYLVYLAWGIATTRPPQQHERGHGRPLTFWQAALFQWVNPKAWVMGLGAVAVFGSADAGVLERAVVIAGCFMLVGFPCVGLWLVLGEWMGRLLRNARHLVLFNRTMAALLLMSLEPLVAEYAGAMF